MAPANGSSDIKMQPFCPWAKEWGEGTLLIWLQRLQCIYSLPANPPSLQFLVALFNRLWLKDIELTYFIKTPWGESLNQVRSFIIFHNIFETGDLIETLSVDYKVSGLLSLKLTRPHFPPLSFLDKAGIVRQNNWNQILRRSSVVSSRNSKSFSKPFFCSSSKQEFLKIFKLFFRCLKDDL